MAADNSSDEPYEEYETIWKKQNIVIWLDLEMFQGWLGYLRGVGKRHIWT